MHCRTKLFVFTLACFLIESIVSFGSDGVKKLSFREHVAPILQTHCLACHGAKRSEGGYRLDTAEYLFKAGDSGQQPIVPTRSSESEVLTRVCSADESIRMPVDSEPLKAETIELLRQWIDEGASVGDIIQSDPLWLVIPPVRYPSAPVHYPVLIPVTALAFSDDGSQIVSSGYHEALVWNVPDGTLAQRFENQVQRIYSIVNLTSGNKIAIAGGTPGTSGEIRVIDRTTGGVEQVISRSNDVVLDVALRPGVNEMAVGMTDNTIRLFDLNNWNERRVLMGHADWVTQVCFSDDGTKLGSASRDKSAKVFDAVSGDLLISYPGHTSAVRGVAHVPGSTQWMSVGADNKWHRWELEGAKKIAVLGFGGEPNKFLKVDQSVLVPCNDQCWYRIELANNTISRKQAGQSGAIASVAYHPATSRVATGSMDGTIYVWNWADGTQIGSWKAKP